QTRIASQRLTVLFFYSYTVIELSDRILIRYLLYVCYHQQHFRGCIQDAFLESSFRYRLTLDTPIACILLSVVLCTFRIMQRGTAAAAAQFTRLEPGPSQVMRTETIFFLNRIQ